jgi:2-polyprenyl-3-methyl-5-hydroxy-6-metoxy-1,4-benzoquinol methylase
MPVSNSFWISSAPHWENQRYHGFLSRIFFSSLHYRRKYLLFILDQLPPGTRVLELGCGSGLLFGELQNKAQLNYTGIDISPGAIANAKENFKQYPNARWECKAIENLEGIEADYVVSAGVLDWISDDVVRGFLQRNKIKNHVHSFSEDRKSFGTFVHRLFSKLISSKSVRYRPRKFAVVEIEENFRSLGHLGFVRHPKLSFGAFVHNLPADVNAEFESLLVPEYFANKGKPSFIETHFKRAELKAIAQALPRLEGLRVLEAGSGHGFYSHWLLQQRPARLLCVDPFVNTARFVPGITFEQIRAEAVQTGPFDVILALGVLEFTPNPVQFLQHLLDLTAPGGRLLLLIPRRGSFVTRLYSWFHHLRGINLAQNLEATLDEFLTERESSFEKIDGGPLNFLFIIKEDGKTGFIRS